MSFTPPVPDPLPLHRTLSGADPTAAEQAYAELVREHGPLVLAACRRALGQGLSGQAPEDAAQMVFLLLWRKRRTLPAGRPLAGWLFNAALLISKELRRAEQRRKQRERRAAEMAAATKETAGGVEHLLNEMLARLPVAEQSAILLHCAESKTYREVGMELGCSEEAARKRVERGLERMRASYRRRGVAISALALADTLAAQTAQAAASAARLSLSPVHLIRPELHAGLSGMLRALWMKSVFTWSAMFLAVLLPVTGLGIYLARGTPIQEIAPGEIVPAPAVSPPAPEVPAATLESGLVYQDDFIGKTLNSPFGSKPTLGRAGFFFLRIRTFSGS